jgi:DNA-binding response OmpR family regulator
MAKRILFIDDDAKIQDLLREYFNKNGFEVSAALTGKRGVHLLRHSEFDIVILDLMLPGMDGFETLKAIKDIFDIPVIMLTALEDETDRIVGLEMGADDYLHKPVNPRELLARIKAVLRRTRGQPEKNAPGAAAKAGMIESMGLTIDPGFRKVWLNARHIDLSTVEFDILLTLVKSKGHVISRDRLLDSARGRTFEAFDRSIDVHISRIRKKIEADPRKPELIKTVWGRGYMWPRGDD